MNRVLIALLAFIAVGTAIRCYSNDINYGKDNPKQRGQIIDCPQDRFCFERRIQTNTNDNEKSYNETRGCGSIGQCRKKGCKGPGENKRCCCEKDGCNDRKF